jgi:hypothetical protein
MTAVLAPAEETPPPTADREMGPPPQVIAAHRALLLDVTARIVRRETDRARRAQATPQKLRAHAESYYDEAFENIVMAMLLPALRTHLAWSGRAEEAADVLRPIVREHLAESVRQLRAFADTHTISADSPDYHAKLEQLLQRWEMERGDTLADRLVRLEPLDPSEPLAIVPYGPRKTIAERERDLHRLMLPTDAELERRIAHQRRQVDEMRKKRSERESDGRVAALVKQ